jgi:hypothetical protein
MNTSIWVASIRVGPISSTSTVDYLWERAILLVLLAAMVPLFNGCCASDALSSKVLPVITLGGGCTKTAPRTTHISDKAKLRSVLMASLLSSQRVIATTSLSMDLLLKKTPDALTAFLDCAVDVGLLCHPGKLTPPSHVVKYTGLIFDSTTELLRVPDYKVDKSLAKAYWNVTKPSVLPFYPTFSYGWSIWVGAHKIASWDRHQSLYNHAQSTPILEQ